MNEMKGGKIMKTTVHIVSHSHWDREWYLPFEKHRMHLVELVDAILEKFETDEKHEIISLINKEVRINNKIEFLNNAVKIYCKSVFEALNEKDVSVIRFVENEL